MSTPVNPIHSSNPRIISVVLATYNEAASITRCLDSILTQVIPDSKLEVLAIDGLSDDGTREILEQYATKDARVRVISNEKRCAPFAFNLGLRVAQGEFICIFGAHTIYHQGYISICLRELLAHRAAGCGGRVLTVPANQSLQARLVAWAISHPFGSSRKSFRTQREGFVDTVNYPIMRRDLLLELGGYDEDLIRNQDNDLNERLRNHGHKLYCTWKTHCFYSSKATLAGLLRYMRLTGSWNVVSLRKNPASMGLRHFAPFIFLSGLICFSFLALAGIFDHAMFVPLATLLGAHLALGSIAAVQVAIRRKSLGALWLPMVFLGVHIAYGYGTLSGFLKNVGPFRRSSENLGLERGGIRSLCASAFTRLALNRVRK